MELKRCPFCGGEAKVKKVSSNYVHSGDAVSITDSWTVICENGCCKMKVHKDNIFHNSDGEIVIASNGAEEAVNDWNRRAGE